jgi:hypothetical protein
VIVVERTFWPLVVIGVANDPGRTSGPMTMAEERFLTAEGVRLAVVVAGQGDRADSRTAS